MKIRNKITTLFTLLTAIALLLLSILIYYFTWRHNNNEFLHRLEVRAGIAAQARFGEGEMNIAVYNQIRDTHLQRLPDEREYFFAFPLPIQTDSLLRILPSYFLENILRNKTANYHQHNTWYVGIHYPHNGTDNIVLLTAENENGQEVLKNLQKNLLVGMIVIVLIVYIAGLLLSREIVNPISRIIHNTQQITATNLHLRLPPSRSKDEIADLNETFNDMLDRLETAFETQSNFVSKASHELRTPLTAIMGEAELSLSRERSAREYQESLNVIQQQAGHLQQLTTSLLELAQVSFDGQQSFMTEVRLDELLLETKRLVDFSEPGNQVHLDFSALPLNSDILCIAGNQLLLKQAFANIIQNASKYSSGQKVVVTITADDTAIHIQITDQGIGISAEDLPHIFEPFFRGSNVASFKGYGIGLPLAQKIIRMHHGQLRFTSQENKGTTVEVLFPVREQQV
ncbi:MAG: HAMP domain-containing sensor histidine kinase [Chitinophagaceae bacterium]